MKHANSTKLAKLDGKVRRKNWLYTYREEGSRVRLILLPPKMDLWTRCLDLSL